ncbi:Amidohydrolase 2 [Mycena chlorophos]|uniref:Amidohydrolase 2 n=1 Tax=Mycena chlorophos TaxID=658473 RepID=A0A8H6RX26_MYCCL|nr:Amidohydrolase 2 [Mycena chlorophos]
MALTSKLVDIHTHIYLPRYTALLRPLTGAPEARLLILDREPSGGRPVGPQYWALDEKLRFMNTHGIDVSLVSSANPWVDFLPPSEAQTLASQLNYDLEEYCAGWPILIDSPTLKRLYGFDLLPVVPGIPVPALLETVQQISKLPHLKGIIMGTRGLGSGLDDESLDPVWDALSQAGLVVFLHPHYGVEATTWGPKDNGHILLWLWGFHSRRQSQQRVSSSRVSSTASPTLRLLLAHSGGALPQLSSRLASCIDHDPIVAFKHDARFYLGQLYFDAVAYGPEEIGFVSDVIARANSLLGQHERLWLH